MYFKLIRVYSLETKSELWWKCWHYIMGYIMKLGSIIFLFALVSSLAYIEYRLCQTWSVYMQYLRCYDHSTKCLFLAIQQVEVLLNFFGGVYTYSSRKLSIWCLCIRVNEKSLQSTNRKNGKNLVEAGSLLNDRCLCETTINTLSPRQNGRHFPDDIFKWIFLNENV